MHRRLLIAGAAAAALVAGFAPALNAAEPVAATPQRVDDFQLTDHTRMHEHLYYYNYVPAVVIMTRVNGSSVSKANSQALEKLNAAYQAKGVVVWGLDSTDGRDSVAAEAKAQKLTVPVLMDEDQLVGESLGVQREGETFVIEPKTWRVVYRGPVSGAAGALDAMVAGGKPELIRTSVTSGKAMAFPGRDHSADISYSKSIAPILQEKCVSCHVNGGIGLFAMNSYETIKGFAPMIRETVRTQRMPSAGTPGCGRSR
jgi:peroxiredoxin